MRREELVMEILGGLDERFIAEAMPPLTGKDTAEDTASAERAENISAAEEKGGEVTRGELRVYMALRALGIAAAAVLVVGGVLLLWRNWDKIAAKDPGSQGEVTSTTAVTSATEASVVTTSGTEHSDPIAAIDEETDPFERITDTSMPDPTGSDDTDYYHNFLSPWKRRFSDIIGAVSDLADSDSANALVTDYWQDHPETPCTLEAGGHLYWFCTELGISPEEAAEALEKNNERYLSGDRRNIDELLYTDEEIAALKSGDKQELINAFASEYSIVVGEYVFSPAWLYYHTAKDYTAAGITREMVSEKYSKYKSLGLTDEGWKAFRQKLAAYIYSGRFYENRRVISFEYGGDLYSDNSYELLTKYFYGRWETEDGYTITLNSEKSPFNFDGYAFPCGISETDDAYIFTYINGGVGGAYIIFKDSPDELFGGEWNGVGYGGITSYPDVVLLNENAVGYQLRERPVPLLSFGEMSVLGEYILKSNHSGKFVEFYDETISSGYTEGFTDESGQTWVLNGSMPLTGSPRYCIDDGLTSVTVGIKYFKKEESDEYMDNGMEYGTEPEGTYFALKFTRNDSGDFSVTYTRLEDDFTKRFETEPTGLEKNTVTVNDEGMELYEYDIPDVGDPWLNADTYRILEQNFYGIWESEEKNSYRPGTVTLTYSKDMFVHEYFSKPDYITETDELYILSFMSGGAGECFAVKKSEPDVLYYGYIEYIDHPESEAEKMISLRYRYRLTERPSPDIEEGEISVLGVKHLLYTRGEALRAAYNDTIENDMNYGYTDGDGHTWEINSSLPLAGEPRYLISKDINGFTLGIKYYDMTEYEEYIDHIDTEEYRPQTFRYFAVTFSEDGSVTHEPLEDDFTKMFEPQPTGLEKYTVPVNIELNCEWSALDREVQNFLTGNEEAYREFSELMLFGWGMWATREDTITRTFPEDTSPGTEYEYYLQKSDSPYFRDADALLDWMKRHFSEWYYNSLYNRMFTAHTYDGGFAPPRFIIEDGKIYRDGGVMPGILKMDFATAKVVEDARTDGNTIFYACMGVNDYFPEHYDALYGAVTYEDGVMKYASLPEIDLYEYRGTEKGDAAEIWGIQ